MASFMNIPCDVRRTKKNNAWTAQELKQFAKDTEVQKWYRMNKGQLCRALTALENNREPPVYEPTPRTRATQRRAAASVAASSRRNRKRLVEVEEVEDEGYEDDDEDDENDPIPPPTKSARRNRQLRTVPDDDDDDDPIPARRLSIRNEQRILENAGYKYEQPVVGDNNDDEGDRDQDLVDVVERDVQTPIQFDPVPDTLDVTLKDHQRMVMQMLLQDDTHGLIVNHSLGSGKTITSIAATEALLERHPDWKVLVIVSAGLIANFEKEIDKALSHRSRSLPKYNIMSREMFLRHPVDCARKVLIVDEAHNLKNDKGKISKAVQKCAAHAAKVLLLTGTPMQNKPSELVTLINMVSRAPVLDTKKFDRTYGEDGMSNRADLMRRIGCKISMYNTPSDSADFPSLEVKDVIVTMSDEHCREYEAREEDKLTDALRAELENVNVARISSNMMSFLTGPRMWSNVLGQNAPKVNALAQNVADAVANGEKVVIYSQYLKSGLIPVGERLNQLGVKFRAFTGAHGADSKRSAVEQYNDGRVKVLMLSAAGGEGLDLKNTAQVHILEPYWNEEVIGQVIGRARRYKSHSGPGPHVVRVYRYYVDKCANSSNDTMSADRYLQKMAKAKDKTVRNFIKGRINPASIEVADCIRRRRTP